MMSFVNDYIEGRMDRISFDLDFSHILSLHYRKMKREHSDLADAFVYYIEEKGLDNSQNLTDISHKRLMKKCYKEFVSIFDDGLI
jgi:hypothetical protein